VAQAWPKIPIDASRQELDLARLETLNAHVYRTVIQAAGVPDASFQRIAPAT